MTVLEAADAMERTRGTRLVVRNDTRMIGILTEEDIVRKVLATGRRPDSVRVGDIMVTGFPQPDGTLLLDEEIKLEGSYEEPLRLRMRQGKCEECGVFSVDLAESDGLILCADCQEPHGPIY
jgi:hypothetical protein